MNTARKLKEVDIETSNLKLYMPGIEEQAESIYEQYGYKNREEYLNSLTDNLPYKDNTNGYIVGCLAEILGEDEDFDGLVDAIDDFNMMNNGDDDD